jgi:energy-coupling factor transporter transmembrane protein EcfT
MFKNKIYLIISILIFLIYIGLYVLSPFGLYIPILYKIVTFSPIITLILIIFKSKLKWYYILLNLTIFIIGFAFLMFVSLNGRAEFSSIGDTNCGSDIKTGYIGTGFGTYQEALLKSHNNGLYYTLHDISSDRSSNGVQNFSQNYGFRYNRKNFYKAGDFEKYRDCLPNVSKICPNYFWISISTDGDGCKDL